MEKLNTNSLDIEHPVPLPGPHMEVVEDYLLSARMKVVLRSIIAKKLTTPDLLSLALTCKGVFAVLRPVLVKRKKAGTRSLAKRRKRSRAVQQPQPQPQNGEYAKRLGRAGKYRAGRWNVFRMIKMNLANYFNLQCQDICVTEVDMGIFRVYVLMDGIVVREYYYDVHIIRAYTHSHHWLGRGFVITNGVAMKKCIDYAPRK